MEEKQYERTTLYLLTDVKSDFDIWQETVQVGNSTVSNLKKREIQNAMVEYILQNEDDFLSYLSNKKSE